MSRNAQKTTAGKYRKSAKGIAARKRAQYRYDATIKGRERKRQYRLSSKGKEADRWASHAAAIRNQIAVKS